MSKHENLELFSSIRAAEEHDQLEQAAETPRALNAPSKTVTARPVIVTR